MSDASFWKRCSSCKNEISFSTIHWVCSVSTCNRKRTGMVFCSVDCWEVHLPMMRHREAYAVEKRSPSRAKWQSQQVDSKPARRSGSASTERGGTPAAKPAAVVRRRVVATPAASTAVSTAASTAVSTASSTAASTVASAAAATASAANETSGAERADDGINEDDLPRDILVVASKLKKYIRARSGFNTSDSVLGPLSDHLRAICVQAIRAAAEDGRKTVLERDIPSVE